MRTAVSLAILFLAAAIPARADDRWHLTVLATDVGAAGNRWTQPSDDAGVGVALSYAFTNSFDIEAAVASKSYRSVFETQVPLGSQGLVPASMWLPYTVYPVELSVAKRFSPSSRVSPYVRAGARHVNAPDFRSARPISAAPLVNAGYDFGDRTSVQVGAGVRLRLTPRTAVRGEVMRLLRDKSAPFDPLTNVSFGLTWLF